jgi:predicted acetyltransferase
VTEPIYRPLEDADRERAISVDAFSFNAPRAGIAGWLTPERLANFRGLFLDGRLAAHLEIRPLRVATGSAELPAAGFGSVAVAPEYRRRGYAPQLLQAACLELRERGLPLAFLYPSQVSFYRRYGWALVVERKVYSGPPATFSEFAPVPGGWQPCGAEAIPELQAVYRGALRGRFGPFVRDDRWWREQVLHEFGQDEPAQAFIWRDEQGQARTYLIFRFTAGSRRERRMICRETVALDPPARSQIFHFMAGLANQCGEVLFRAPADAPVNVLMPEPLRCEVEPYLMLRIVDVPAALQGLEVPEAASGSFSLAIHDAWLAPQQAVYRIEAAAGRLQVTPLPADTPADLACAEPVLAQIISRYLRPRTAAAFGLLDVHDRAALKLFDRQFLGLMPFNSDFF